MGAPVRKQWRRLGGPVNLAHCCCSHKPGTLPVWGIPGRQPRAELSRAPLHLHQALPYRVPAPHLLCSACPCPIISQLFSFTGAPALATAARTLCLIPFGALILSQFISLPHPLATLSYMQTAPGPSVSEQTPRLEGGRSKVPVPSQSH